ncbi:kinesin-like protein KIF25 isoform X2 [Patiria miniata]|uniref:Kinesin motor domain-containing protein n=1 Tax=Patiria miniata TaxID=46514 RepID=A0A914A8N8_PATMI|nr:kinesin-like protein KIF25 isoform X2 [Patiria miniata]
MPHKPTPMDLSHFIPDKIKECDRKLRQKDERIVALETENAMLYLRLAQLQGELGSTREAMGHMKRVMEAEDDSQLRIGHACIDMHHKVKECKHDLQQLRDLVESVPSQVTFDLDLLQEKAARLTQSLLTDNLDMQDLRDRVYELEEEVKTADQRFTKEKKRRKEIHNTLVELRGNIRVHCRARPIMSRDAGPGIMTDQVVHIIDDENLAVKYNKPGIGASNKMFEFEHVYGPLDNQFDVFEEVQPLLTSLLDGYNVCIMAYGQTGSGKTYTMLGDNYSDLQIDEELEIRASDGVVPRAAVEMFKLIAEKPANSHSIEVSVVEIYNNDIRDLLEPDAAVVKLNIRTCDDGSMEIPSLTQRQVENASEIVELVQYGMKHRHEDATLVHAHSSRSHLIVTLTVSTFPQGVPTTTPNASRSASPVPELPSPGSFPARNLRRNLSIPAIAFQSLSLSGTNSPLQIQSGSSTPVFFPPSLPGVVKTKLQLVDLAGSECVGMSGVTGAALRETSHINRSLSALSDVLAALAEGRSHVPYRNSRLTHLLQDSIGGDAKLLVLCCVSPTQAFVTETLQCLGFGTRARQVQRGQTKKRTATGSGGQSSGSTAHSSQSGELSPIAIARNRGHRSSLAVRSVPNLESHLAQFNAGRRSPRPLRPAVNRSDSSHK